MAGYAVVENPKLAIFLPNPIYNFCLNSPSDIYQGIIALILKTRFEPTNFIVHFLTHGFSG